MGIRAKEIADETEISGIKSVVFAGGGTGGHLFPGIALAEEFTRRNPGCRVVFVSSGRPLEERVLAETGFEKYRIPVEGIKGRRGMAKLKTAVRLPFSLFYAMALLVRVRPDVVIGMGGYSAGPVVLAAWMLGRRRVICEQNRLPGMTNRILARFAQRIYVSFPDTFANAPADKTVLAGNPVRRRIVEALSTKETKTAFTKHENGRFTVLVLGGSQGAKGINRAVTGALDHLAEKETYHFIHQTGEHDVQAVAAAYAEKNFSAVVASFFADMAALYRQADLVICRSGATTVAEIAVAGKAAVFVPFPHATDDHQRHNAVDLVGAGAAEMILENDLNAEELAEKIVFYRQHPAALTAMQTAMKGFGRPDAAKKIVDDIVSGNWKKETGSKA
jgi:UDP-N-acetylglucosamine--N-acetylmuramyl-(pentapeptide) pyrophosphoryl-undecaprenol N-acetylglucosamine transferase